VLFPFQDLPAAANVLARNFALADLTLWRLHPDAAAFRAPDWVPGGRFHRCRLIAAEFLA